MSFSALAEGSGSDAYYYYQVGEWSKAADAYLEILGDKPSKDDLERAIEACYYSGRIDKALELLQRVPEASTDPVFITQRYLILAKKGEKKRSIVNLQQMVKEYPHDYRVLTALGSLVAAEGRTEGLSYLSRAVAENPDYFRAWFQMGVIYETEELFDEAIKAYRNAVRINPLSAQAHNNLGYSYKEKHFYFYAAEEYKKAISLMPDNAGYYYNIGNVYTHEGKLDAAFDSYKKAIELDPKFAKAHYNMARTYLRKDMFKEAIDEFRLYLKYGNKDIFDFVASREAVKDEIENLESFLEHDSSGRPAPGTITK